MPLLWEIISASLSMSLPGRGRECVELRYPKENDTEALGTRIILDHVSFAYPIRRNTLLKIFRLLYLQGNLLLWWEKNGAGKTTLARLILGLYSPVKGRIIYELPRGTPKDKDPDHPRFRRLKTVLLYFKIIKDTLCL